MDETRLEAPVFSPRPALAGCIFGAFVRDTRDHPLGPAQRFNHFAATPYRGVTWFFEGKAHMLDWPSGLPSSKAFDPHIDRAAPYSGSVTIGVI